MLKMIVSDLDGTLLNPDHMIDYKIEGLLETIKKTDYIFAPATGRALHNHEAARLKLDCFDRICCNGSYIRNKNGVIIYQQLIEKDFIKEVLENFHNEDITYIGKEFSFSPLSFEKKVMQAEKLGYKELAGSPLRVRDFLIDFVFDADNEDILSKEIYKIDCRFDDEEKINRMNKILKKHQKTVINNPAYRGTYEITSINANKANAINYLLSAYSLIPDEVAVFGDGGNDIEMLSEFHNSYTPSDGSEKAKAVAHNIIEPNADYGVCNKIYELINM